MVDDILFYTLIYIMYLYIVMFIHLTMKGADSVPELL